MTTEPTLVRPGHRQPAPATDRCARHAITERLEAADRSEAKLANEPIDSTEAADPTLPMLRTEPTEPIDRNELVDPMLSIELRDA